MVLVDGAARADVVSARGRRIVERCMAVLDGSLILGFECLSFRASNNFEVVLECGVVVKDCKSHEVTSGKICHIFFVIRDDLCLERPHYCVATMRQL